MGKVQQALLGLLEPPSSASYVPRGRTRPLVSLATGADAPSYYFGVSYTRHGGTWFVRVFSLVFFLHHLD